MSESSRVSHHEDECQHRGNTDVSPKLEEIHCEGTRLLVMEWLGQDRHPSAGPDVTEMCCTFGSFNKGSCGLGVGVNIDPIKACPRDGRLEIHGKSIEGSAHLTMVDEGCELRPGSSRSG